MIVDALERIALDQERRGYGLTSLINAVIFVKDVRRICYY